MRPDFSQILFGLNVHSIRHFFWHRKHSPSSQFKTDICCFFFVRYWSTRNGTTPVLFVHPVVVLLMNLGIDESPELFHSEIPIC